MIRPYTPSDLPALRRICLLTGRAGTDATGQYSSDELLPDVFLEPYVTLAPESAWVLELGAGPVGYLVAALHTREFAAAWREIWVPEFRRRHPVAEPGEEWLHEWAPAEVDGYPAHLHIDLLPSAQGGGWGRALMLQLGAAAVAAGVPGIHLAMARDNLRALAFYERLGFTRLTADGGGLVLGIRSAALA
jgi:ribosomal protein S18 acetylase RimI-like enzyme